MRGQANRVATVVERQWQVEWWSESNGRVREQSVNAEVSSLRRACGDENKNRHWVRGVCGVVEIACIGCYIVQWLCNSKLLCRAFFEVRGRKRERVWVFAQVSCAARAREGDKTRVQNISHLDSFRSSRSTGVY